MLLLPQIQKKLPMVSWNMDLLALGYDRVRKYVDFVKAHEQIHERYSDGVGLVSLKTIGESMISKLRTSPLTLYMVH